MEIDKFEPYDIVKNTINGALGVVVKTSGENVTIQPGQGERITFRCQYLVRASDSEAAASSALRERVRSAQESLDKPKAAADPALIKAEFEKFARHIAVRYPRAGAAFREFWSELTAAIGDLPGQTWEMRPNSVKNPCPVIKVYSPKAAKWVYLMYVQAGWDLRMEIKKEFLPAGAEKLFPIDNAMYGQGRAVELKYQDFKPEARAGYLDCLKAIYAAAAIAQDRSPDPQP